MLDGVSQCTSQLSVLIILHEIEVNHNEARKPSLVTTLATLCMVSVHSISFTFFTKIGCSIIGWDRICVKMLLVMLSTYFLCKQKIDIFWPNHFRSRFLKIMFSDFVYGFSDCITYYNWIVAWNNDLCAKHNFPVESFKNVICCSFLSLVETRL